MFIKEEGNMDVCRYGEAKGFEEEDLARGGGEQVNTTYDLVDVHECVINDDGKLIGEDAV
jgi:hypothetical protein